MIPSGREDIRGSFTPSKLRRRYLKTKDCFLVLSSNDHCSGECLNLKFSGLCLRGQMCISEFLNYKCFSILSSRTTERLMLSSCLGFYSRELLPVRCLAEYGYKVFWSPHVPGRTRWVNLRREEPVFDQEIPYENAPQDHALNSGKMQSIQLINQFSSANPLTLKISSAKIWHLKTPPGRLKFFVTALGWVLIYDDGSDIRKFTLLLLHTNPISGSTKYISSSS